MTVYYDKENQFELTNDEFKKALPAFNSGKNVWIDRLKVHLTPFYKWAGQKPDDPNIGYTRDGRKVFKKFGEWRFMESPELIPDLKYYPELTKDTLPGKKDLVIKN